MRNYLVLILLLILSVSPALAQNDPPCEGMNRFSIGARGGISSNGDRLSAEGSPLLAEPVNPYRIDSTGAPLHPVLINGYLPYGSRFVVIDGAVCDEFGTVYWEIQARDGSISGWAFDSELQSETAIGLVDPFLEIILRAEDGSLIFMLPDYGFLNTLPLSPEAQVWLAFRQIYIYHPFAAQIDVDVPNLFSNDFSIALPISDATIVDFLPPAYGASNIAWLLDVGSTRELWLTDRDENNDHAATFTENDMEVELIGWSEDRTTLFLRQTQDNVSFFATATLEESSVVPTYEDYAECSDVLSSNGQWLGCANEAIVRVLGFENETVYEIAHDNVVIGDMSFSPDSARLVWVETDVQGNHTLQIMRLSDGTLQMPVTLAAGDADLNVWLSETLLVVKNASGDFWSVDIVTGDTYAWAGIDAIATEVIGSYSVNNGY